MKKVWNVISYIISIAVCIGILYLGYFSYNNSDKALEYINNFWEEHFDHKLVQDENEKNNFKELLNSGEVVNRNYIDAEFFPYYALLTENEKEVYYDILEGAQEYKEFIVPSRKIKLDEVSNIYHAVMFDHPELFWLDGKYSYDYYHDNDEVIKITLNYTNTINDIEHNRDIFNTAVNTIVDVAKTYELDYEKEKYVHDALINIITYDDTYKDDQSAFGALIHNKGVCAGYAKSFQIIMTKLGIPTYYITGTADGEHAWNLILLDDGYYNIDLTWDDQVDRIIYKYYNVNEDMITKDHTRKDLSTKIVKAEGTKYINKYSTLGD